MLKTIREGALGNPWFFRLIMFGIAAVFAVSMGWWGFGDTRDEEFIATAGEDPVTIQEYQLAYSRTSRVYRELFQDQYDDEKIRKQVIDDLVDNKLWAQEARRMGLVLSDGVLKEAFLTTVGFQSDGKFNPDVYKRFLANLGLSPKVFEEMQREVLLIEKVKLMVKGGVVLTPLEIKDVEENSAENMDLDRVIEDRLARKKNRAILAYTQFLRGKVVISIKEELL